jgi:hypothetical protein
MRTPTVWKTVKRPSAAQTQAMPAAICGVRTGDLALGKASVESFGL